MTQLFISSVQKEFQSERYAIRDFVNKDALLSQFFTVFLFEDLPPVDQRPDEVYLDEVKDSPIYVGLFGNQYGNWRDENGLSPTEKEYRLATELRKRRLVLVKQGNDPEPEMKNLINRAGDELVRKRFGSTEEMLSLLHRSLIQYLRDEGVITTKEFDAQTYEGASLADMVPEKIRRFLELAKAERSYALSLDSSIETVLAHLDLLADGRPTKGALLLFGDRPKRHVSGADINCLHFHGTEVVKPIPSQQVYQGTVFEMVDAAVDFVMSKLTRRVIPSSQKVASDVEYEHSLQGGARGDRQRAGSSQLHLQGRGSGHAVCRPTGSLELGRAAGRPHHCPVAEAASLRTAQPPALRTALSCSLYRTRRNRHPRHD
jgi:ATP-dependent DNA helicase RecG